jgi:hypothetical protein
MRLELGANRKWLSHAQNVADGPQRKSRGRQPNLSHFAVGLKVEAHHSPLSVSVRQPRFFKDTSARRDIQISLVYSPIETNVPFLTCTRKRGHPRFQQKSPVLLEALCRSPF